MTDKKLTDSEIVKDVRKNTEGEKIKAIYPHITTSIVYEKPYYMITWYDIESKTMKYGYGSFNFEYVCEWKKEYFEIVEDDFADLINRLQAENIALNRRAIPSSGHILKVGSALLFAENKEDYNTTINAIKAEAYKEFAEKLKESSPYFKYVLFDDIDNLLKELVGDNNGITK